MNGLSRFDRPPIIIGGCGRSGTSLLLAVLSAHPSVLAIAHETEAFCPTAWSKNFDPQAPFEIEKIEALLSAQERGPSMRRWCEKSPKNVLFFDRILEYFGSEVRLIHLVRDGRDVITSRHPTRRRDGFWVSPERWINDVKAGLKFEKHPQVLTLRYEDLVLDFMKTVTALLHFLDEAVHEHVLSWHEHATVRRHPAWADEVPRLHARSIGRWRERAYQALVSRFMADKEAVVLLSRLGYLNGKD